MEEALFTLGMSDQAQQLVLEGKAKRIGGVVYHLVNGRPRGIVEHLSDRVVAEKAQQPAQVLYADNPVPLAMLNVSLKGLNQRLAHIEEQLNALREELQTVTSLLNQLHAKFDGALLGRLKGVLWAADIALQEGNQAMLTEQRQECLIIYEQMKGVAERLCTPEFIRTHPAVVEDYLQAMFLAGVAARDLSWHIAQEDSTRSIAQTVATDAKQLTERLESVMQGTSGLFWLERVHLNTLRCVREARDRLSGHVEALPDLTQARLQHLAVEPLDN